MDVSLSECSMCAGLSRSTETVSLCPLSLSVVPRCSTQDFEWTIVWWLEGFANGILADKDVGGILKRILGHSD